MMIQTKKETPILFSTEMVKAILEGRKTQTRRVIKPQPHEEESLECGYYYLALVDKDGEQYPDDKQTFGAYTLDGEYTWKCPYGQVGDKLWVRETFYINNRFFINEPKILYKADGHEYIGKNWKPSIYMPKWACRIWLEITDIRIERIQDISIADCRKEGIKYLIYPNESRTFEGEFERLWNSINEKRGYGWDKNPWVWVISFKIDSH